MPQKNVVREFSSKSIYHVYNRGVEKRQIFMDEQDYRVFFNRLKRLLSDPELLDKEHDGIKDRLQSFHGEVELLVFCLMPNHFHLLLYQKTDHAISEFMRALSTSYTMYFNKHYDRVGSLFQGTYKARLVDNEAYWQHISRYIHLNPETLGYTAEGYPYSSMKYYSRESSASWVSPSRVLKEFKSYKDYLSFVNEYSSKIESLEEELTLN